MVFGISQGHKIAVTGDYRDIYFKLPQFFTENTNDTYRHDGQLRRPRNSGIPAPLLVVIEPIFLPERSAIPTRLPI